MDKMICSYEFALYLLDLQSGADISANYFLLMDRDFSVKAEKVLISILSLSYTTDYQIIIM